jgi:hypothetical protein
MKWFPLLSLAALACQLVGSAATPQPADPVPGGGDSDSAHRLDTLPPVLRSTEPADNRVLTLPGPPLVIPALKKMVPVVPEATPAAMPSTLIFLNPLRREALPKPLVATAVKRAPGSEFLPGAPPYQKQIGHWKQSDASKTLGEPKRQRPAYDETNAINGTIYAFADPTSRYKELELDFEHETGSLRTVFAYPARLTWPECRRLWGVPTTSADAKQGRTFHSYINRRLDVLVDAEGKVISLGWY